MLMSSYGTTTVDSNILAVAYYRAKDWPRLINMWSLRAHSSGADAQTWFGLAAAYYASGDSADAIKTINTAVSMFPDAAASAAQAIAQIKAGTPVK